MPGSLYLIAGPIGNLEDITLRAQRYLRELKCFFCEDTRELKKLYAGLGIESGDKEFHSYASHNLKAATERAIEKLESGVSVGFLSDRGTPGISDPGAVLCEAALSRGIPVVPIPGPSAVTSLLSVSGLAVDRFIFLGFLPRKDSEKEELWLTLEKANLTFCFFESPERVTESVNQIRARFPRGTVVVGRELTKSFESVLRFKADGEMPDFPAKGEFVVAVQPGTEPVPAGPEDLQNRIAERLASEREWAKIMAKQLGVAVSDVYNALQKAKQNQ